MKNSDVTSLWNEYIETLTDNHKRKVAKIESAIDEFESQGYQLEKITRNEAKILADILGRTITYASTKNYCCVLNNFLRLYEERYNCRVEKVYANRIKSNENLYYSEDEFLDDVETWVNQNVDEVLLQRTLSSYEIEELKDSYLSSVCLLILRWYGITFEEIRMLKKVDVVGNKIILPNREKTINNRALSYITKYKNQLTITHFWRTIIRHNLPDSEYVFRREGVNKSPELLEPLTSNLLSVLQCRFLKGSPIKKYISLSGAFCSIEEKISKPENLCERVHEYLGDELISDINIKKSWIGYLDGIE